MANRQIQKSTNTDHHEKIILDRDMKLILESTYDVSKSANQIILDSNIAQSTAYRKLKKLASMNFLQIKYVIGEHGGWEMRYKNNLGLFGSGGSNDDPF